MDMVPGIVGDVAGGWLFRTFEAPGVTGLNIWSVLVSIIGAVVVLSLYHVITGRGRPVVT
jgi:uncharacterized membrane protein YeaQ/YmgE (transglycosylase-associated protein family)